MTDLDKATATMIANLAKNTGKTLDAWVAIARAAGIPKHGALVAWLKETHELGHGYANLIAHTLNASAAATSGSSDDDLVAAQFSGAKAALRPIYDALVKAVTGLGKDVELAPKKANVSVRRAKQFALLQASTATRFDVGTVLKGVAPGTRLEAAGSFNSMVTHRVRLGSAAEVDAELIGWLRQAYAAAG